MVFSIMNIAEQILKLTRMHFDAALGLRQSEHCLIEAKRGRTILFRLVDSRIELADSSICKMDRAIQ